MTNSALRFLLSHDGHPYQPSRCYVVADPEIDNRKQWTVQLDPPVDATWVYEIDDMKDWMLHGKPKRQIIFDRKNPRTPFRDLERDQIFREYLRAILERIPEPYQSRRKYALMPSISDDETRARYKDAIEAAIPGAIVFPEPEMVAEYFRLIKRNLELEAGQNNVLLVVDVGASTANMTLIVSRRDRTILDVDIKGSQRDLRLRALRGDSDDHAGRWVDKRLAAMLGIDETPVMLRRVEQAKVQASSPGNMSSKGAPLSIEKSMLAAVSTELWMELRPLFEKLCERLYDNQTSSESARQRSRDRLVERGVQTPADAHRLIDTILLAGGTSMLPGFEDAMMATLFPGDHRPTVLRVGESFAVAAAAGGLAHILHNYSPSRLRETDGIADELFAAQLETTLPHALLLGIKQDAEREQYVTLLDPNDPFIDDGGVREIENLPLLSKGAEPKSRLLPSSSAGVDARRGRKFKAMRIVEAPPRFSLEWDPEKERAFVSSNDASPTSHLWIDVNRLRKREEDRLQSFTDPLPADALAVDGAEDIVLDIGMSKIVVVTAERGWISTREIERIVRDGDAPLTTILPEATGEDFKLPNGSISDDEETEFLTEDGVHRSQQDDQPEVTQPVARGAALVEPANANDAGARDEYKAPHSGDATEHGEIARAQIPDTPAGWDERVVDAEFTDALTSLRDTLRERAPALPFDDIVVALLALSVRPIVLLAGPPGCGKSTLVRLISRMLGKRLGHSFHDVAVQAHWTNDDALFGEKGLLCALEEQPSVAHLVLLDEFNLTRPEYYLSRLFHAFDSGSGELSAGRRLPSCRVFGTLNIDDSSRPPSPKVVDRCFLLELSQVNFGSDDISELPVLDDLVPLPGLPHIAQTGVVADERIEAVLNALHRAVHGNDLRHDLLPSRRVLWDIRSMLGLHHRLDLQGRSLLDRSDLVDRLISSRILIKLSGAYDQLGPALSALEAAVADVEELPRTQRRLKLARQQARLGFVSPWQ
ncbi:AAA family ATPase [Novosphingobium sp. MMS21-SN21R]|uniref:AAA family ATPase n=1 Tax=Novosphingobium sp. MMS21-SN21R TaxID=2969298 RepID=UPI00288501A5|nr:AAA family ATPase [Novosphingobium sp. MMS21-SN21R]MDT0506929.1 AAA family ATPase [Novosphingobium sp. MMS21-SN21R]